MRRPAAGGRGWFLLAPLSVVLLACGCKSAKEIAKERATQEGSAASLPGGTVGAKPTASSKAPVAAGPSEADFGLPFYPGAILDPDSVQKVEMGAYYQTHASFSTDAGPEKVALFYRAKLKARAATPDALTETRVADKTTFILKRDVGNLSLVAIEPTEGTTGSDIQLTATGLAAGAPDTLTRGPK